MDKKVGKLVEDYKTLAKEAVKLNNDYLKLLDVYKELIFVPELLGELEKSGESPIKVVAKMQKAQEAVISGFDRLLQAIADLQPNFSSDDPEAKELKNTDQDCSKMKDFVTTIDMTGLQNMFAGISNN